MLQRLLRGAPRGSAKQLAGGPTRRQCAPSSAVPAAGPAAGPSPMADAETLEHESSRLLTRELEIASGQGEAEDTLAGVTDPRQLMALGASYKKDGRFDAAVTAYERVGDIDKKNPDAPIQLAMCLMHVGDMDRADTMFQKALEFYDNVSKPELWHALGQLYALQEKSTQAEESFNQVLETPNLAADVHFRMAVLASATQNFDKAVDHLKRAIPAVDGNEGSDEQDLTAADIWFELGDVYTLKGEPDEAELAYENSCRAASSHAAWNAHGQVLDKMVGFDGKGGALRRKALRAMVRSVEMAQDQPRYWQTLAALHRRMHSYDEAFDALEHFARLSVTRADRVEAEREALQASLQEAGESALHVAEELARVRAVFEEEQLARESFHQEQEENKRRMETLQKNSEAFKKEAEKYKGWLEAIRKENRICKLDVEKNTRIAKEANEKWEESKKETLEQRQEVKKRDKRLEAQKKDFEDQLLSLGGGGDSGIRQTPEEMVNEMQAKCRRLEEAAESADQRVQVAKREANVRVVELEKELKITVEELERTASRLKVCEKKLENARQELGMLKGTPDGEAFAAANQYKAEGEKSLALAKQRQEEAIKAREHEKLAHTQALMIEGQLRSEIDNLKASRARLATKLQGIEERNADDHEELRKLKAMDAHWEQKSATLEAVVEEERTERERWEEQYHKIKGSLDKAAETAVAQQALRVVDTMEEIEATSQAFESYLEAVLSQHPHEAGNGLTVVGEEGGVPGSDEPGVAVEMGVQCDGVYTELEADLRLEGMDANVMHEKCKEVQGAVTILLEDARDTINAQRHREANLHEQVAEARAKEQEMREKLKEGRAELRRKTLEAQEVAKDADARAETEAELRKFTEWKMRAKMQESKKRWAGEQGAGRANQIQFQQDKMTEMVRGGNGRPTSAMSMPGPMASGGGYTPTGGGRPKSAAAIVQNISSRMVR